MKKLLLLVLIIFCFAIAPAVNAQKLKKTGRNQKALPPKPKAARLPLNAWTLMSEGGATIHQKIRFTPGTCQRVESWTYIFGGAEKLTVQAGTAGATDCPAYAQWESVPLSALKLSGFSPEDLEFGDEAQRKIRKLTLQEGFIQVGDLMGSTQIRKYHPALLRLLKKFNLEVLFLAIQNETKSLALSRKAF